MIINGPQGLFELVLFLLISDAVRSLQGKKCRKQLNFDSLNLLIIVFLFVGWLVGWLVGYILPLI